MSKERRRHERFPIKLTAYRTADDGTEVELELVELSIGGCFVKSFAEARAGLVFQLRIPLLDETFMRLNCKVRYRFLDLGVGVQFMDITPEEQEPLAEIIMIHLWETDLPADAPYAPPASMDKPRQLDFVQQ